MSMLDKFEKLCTQIYYWKGKFRFPFDEIKHDGNFDNIIKNPDYKTYESKMKNLIKIINNDMSKLNLDTKELWEMI